MRHSKRNLKMHNQEDRRLEAEGKRQNTTPRPRYDPYPNLAALAAHAVSAGYAGYVSPRGVPAMLAWLETHQSPLADAIAQATAVEEEAAITPDERDELRQYRAAIVGMVLDNYDDALGHECPWRTEEEWLAPGTDDDGPEFVLIKLLGLGEIEVRITHTFRSDT